MTKKSSFWSIITTSLVFAVVLSAVTTAVAVYGQVAAGPAQDIEIIESETIKRQLSYFLSDAARLTNYTLYQDGRAIYVLEGEPPYASGRTITIEVHTTHNYTPERGYIFNASGVFTTEGKRLIIETSD